MEGLKVLLAGDEFISKFDEVDTRSSFDKDELSSKIIFFSQMKET